MAMAPALAVALVLLDGSQIQPTEISRGLFLTSLGRGRSIRHGCGTATSHSATACDIEVSPAVLEAVSNGATMTTSIFARTFGFTIMSRVARWAGIAAFAAKLHAAPYLSVMILVVTPGPQITSFLGCSALGHGWGGFAALGARLHSPPALPGNHKVLTVSPRRLAFPGTDVSIKGKWGGIVAFGAELHAPPRTND